MHSNRYIGFCEVLFNSSRFMGGKQCWPLCTVPFVLDNSKPNVHHVQTVHVVTEMSIFIKLHLIHSLVFSLEGRAWQEPEPSHVTGMALAHCILGKFLGVVCHCFLLPLDVPTLAARCLHPHRHKRSWQRKVELWARKMSNSNFA